MKQLIVGEALLALAGGASATEWKANDKGDLAMTTSEDGGLVTMAMIVANNKQGILGPSLSMTQRDACKIVSLEKEQSGTYKYMMAVDSAVVVDMRASCIEDDSVMFDAEGVQERRFLCLQFRVAEQGVLTMIG